MTENFITAFDKFLCSRSSLVLNWVWKSGLMLALIFGVINVLIELRVMRNDLNVNSRMLTKIEQRQVICEDGVVKLSVQVFKNENDIKYLRRDIDGLGNIKSKKE